MKRSNRQKSTLKNRDKRNIKNFFNLMFLFRFLIKARMLVYWTNFIFEKKPEKTGDLYYYKSAVLSPLQNRQFYPILKSAVLSRMHWRQISIPDRTYKQRIQYWSAKHSLHRLGCTTFTWSLGGGGGGGIGHLGPIINHNLHLLKFSLLCSSINICFILVTNYLSFRKTTVVDYNKLFLNPVKIGGNCNKN